MTRKFITLFLATFALSATVQATTPTDENYTTMTLGAELTAEEAEERILAGLLK